MPGNAPDTGNMTENKKINAYPLWNLYFNLFIIEQWASQIHSMWDVDTNYDEK